MCSSFDMIAWMFQRFYALTFICPSGIYQKGTSALGRQMAGWGFTSARTRIRWSFTCLVCVSVTTARSCPPRTRHHCNRRPHCSHYRSDCLDGFTKLLCYSFGSQHSGACARQDSCVLVWLDSETCSRARHGESTLGGRCSRHNETSSVVQQSSLTVSLYWQALVRTRHHWKRPRRVVGKTGSDIHVAITWISVRLHGQFVPRSEVSVSMSSFCCSSLK